MPALCCGGSFLDAITGAVAHEAECAGSPEQEYLPDAYSDKKRYDSLVEAGLCPLCSGYPPFGYIICMKCVDKRRINNEQARASGKCDRCPAKAVPGKSLCAECVVVKRAQNKQYYKKLKDLVYEAYGGYICASCGETDETALQIDHVNNDGYEHRKQVKAGAALFRFIIANNFPDDFQILCAGCNWKKRSELKKHVVTPDCAEGTECRSP